MKQAAIPASKKRAVNLSLEKQTVIDAPALGINLSDHCQKALAAEVKREHERRWKEENRDAMDGWNDWVEKNGLPLAKYRMF